MFLFPYPFLHLYSLSWTWARIHETPSNKPVSVTGLDSVTVGDAGFESWFANLVAYGYVFMNPSPGYIIEITEGKLLTPPLTIAKSMWS
ncbi:hypothetical protein Y032_0014g2322 [Ancylostoma ceylanicum]|uniref:Uncharacterized protein n=1 Tax=Ancylostoma ceylanicum TaxID=53326 RepID=A0A016V9L1_9BILA|nr:hypothetical protein Y032_0014g2322 [Ancylostoma ceylanicum]